MALALAVATVLPAFADAPATQPASPPAVTATPLVPALVPALPPAQKPPPPARPHHPRARATPSELGKVARRAQRVNGGGRVLSVHAADDGYHVRLLKHGEVRVIIIPKP